MQLHHVNYARIASAGAVLNLRAMQHAIAVADHGSFVSAARAVHLSQPALSRSVQTLERSIGARLFDRAAGAVRPTDAGTIFLDRARQLVAQAEALELDTGRLRHAREADIAIGAATYCADGLTDLAVARLLRRHCETRISVITDHWASLLQSLRRQDVHLVVADTTVAEQDPTLHVEPLARSQGLFAVRAEHPLAGRPEVKLADVLRHPLVTTSRLTARVMEPLLKGASSGQRPDLVPIACESLSMMKGIALGSDAVAILPMRAMFAELESGDLVLLPPRPPWLHGRFGIATLRGRALSEISLQFVEALREVDAQTEARARAEELRIFGDAERRDGARKAARTVRRRPG
jgi:DNA-binding transcriptional LysR family regulator